MNIGEFYRAPNITHSALQSFLFIKFVKTDIVMTNEMLIDEVLAMPVVICLELVDKLILSLNLPR